MKGLIITLTGNYNYGNRLQNYALQEVLLKIGIEIETYNNIYTNPKTIEIKRKMISKDFHWFVQGIKKRISFSKKYNKINSKRSKNIGKFTKQYIKMSNSSKKDLSKNYDCFVLGSDQVWNPNFTNDFDVNLGYVGKDKNVISYAASFGVNKINKEILELYATSFNNMNAISVREESGKKIVKEISNKEAKVVLDPTMLLSAHEWRNVEKRPEICEDEKYILVYCVSETYKKMKKYIEQLSNKHNLKIINLTDKTREEYTSGVGEFLYYIDNAEMIITDSFHACVFSILFKKDFWIMNRAKRQKGMNSRIDTLLNTFNITNRKLYKDQKFEKCKYENLDKILEDKRNESIQFLHNSLKI